MTERPPLTVILSTHVSLEGMEIVGILERHKRLMRAYAESLTVHVYSSDAKDYSARLGVAHHPAGWLSRRKGIGHAYYFVWLVLQARSMRGVIKVFGSNIPTLPLVRRLSGRPMMVTYQWDYARGTAMNEPRSFRGWVAPFLERCALARADLVLVTTSWLEERVRTRYRKETVLLPNWVELNRSAPREEEREAGLILFAGRLHWIKGADLLVSAFADLGTEHPGARLLVCGEGDERSRLEEMRRARSLSRVEIPGPLPQAEIFRLMERASIFVLPTLTMEGHPKALVEAMSAGAACVVSDVPGMEMVRDG